MTDVTKVAVGIVVKADGSVPFDADVHPNVKTAILGHLVEQGHVLRIDPDTGHHKIEGWKPGVSKVHRHEMHGG